MDFPKITVITPTFNTGQSIGKTLLSVSKQTYQNTEHILVDGASGDVTLKIIRDFQDNRHNIRLFSEPDEGIYDAMNKGLGYCLGEWIYFLGAGDEFYSQDVLMVLFESGLFNEEQVVYGNVIINGDTNWAMDNTIYDGPFDLVKLFKINICHQSIFYPRSVIRNIGFYNKKYKVTADWDYNIRCFASYKFTYIDLIIASFQAGGKSTASNDHSLHDDLPYNVIRYFNLDPDDPGLHMYHSPFYHPMVRYRELELQKTIETALLEIHRLQTLVSAREQEISSILHSWTWKAGKILSAPFIFVIRKINKWGDNNLHKAQNVTRT